MFLIDAQINFRTVVVSIFIRFQSKIVCQIDKWALFKIKDSPTKHSCMCSKHFLLKIIYFSVLVIQNHIENLMPFCLSSSSRYHYATKRPQETSHKKNCRFTAFEQIYFNTCKQDYIENKPNNIYISNNHRI